MNSKIKSEYEIILDSYKDKKRVATKAVIGEMIKNYGINPLSTNRGDDYLRLYIKDNLKEESSLTVGLKYLNISVPITFKDLNLKLLQSRAYSNIPDEINSKTAVVAIYGNKSGDFISCPGDALPQDVVNLYDWVCIISIDKLVPIEN